MCGDLHEERWASLSGNSCSTYLIQPGEQEVIIGRTTSWPRTAASARWRNSVPSSRIVRSAAKFVSKTSSKPRRRRAWAIFAVTMVPGSIPNISPSATRTAGAVWTTVRTFGLKRAFQTGRLSTRVRSAPTGQTMTHWPQLAQAEEPSGRSAAGPIVVPKPR